MCKVSIGAGMTRVQRIGRYTLVKPLANGGMGRVWLARAGGLPGFERHVIIKTLETPKDDSFITMFLDEARVLARMHHHHIAPMFEIDCTPEGKHFLVMEYVHGFNAQAVWEEAVEMSAALPLDFAVTVALAAASALHYAHTRTADDGKRLDIVHRDVSLANLMVGFDGSVKLIDFGIAKAVDRSTMTQTGYIKGKLGYMAPEQVNLGTIDHRTDVFALGVVLYELTTMVRAFRAHSDLETLERIRKGTLVPPSAIIPDYPRELELIVLKALQSDPAARFQTADAMRRELEGFGHRHTLVVGDSAVAEVMAQLFENVEPWRDRVEPSLPAIPHEISNHETMPIDSARTAVRYLRAATEVADQMIIEVRTRGRTGTEPDLDESTLRRGGSEPAPRLHTPLRPETIPPPLISRTMRVIAPSTKRSRRPSLRGAVRSALVLGMLATVVVAMDFAPTSEATTAPSVQQPRAALAADVVAHPAGAISRELAAIPVAPATPPPAAQPTEIHIHIATDPADATVLLDGQRLGHTPYDGSVAAAPGAHVLKIRRRGYAAVKLDVSLDSDISRTVTLTTER